MKQEDEEIDMKQEEDYNSDLNYSTESDFFKEDVKPELGDIKPVLNFGFNQLANTFSGGVHSFDRPISYYRVKKEPIPPPTPRPRVEENCCRVEAKVEAR